MRARLIPSLLVLLFVASIFPHTAQAGNNPVDRPLKMSDAHLQLDWGITGTQELDCGGNKIAGGHSSGQGNFTHLGQSSIEVSAAWDIGHQLDPADAQFVPTGPAGGPVAPVLGTGAYPYQFQFNPFTGECSAAVAATGEVKITAANGDEVFGAMCLAPSPGERRSGSISWRRATGSRPSPS